MFRLMLAGLAVSSLAFAQTEVQVKKNSAGGVEVNANGQAVKVEGTNVQVNDKKVNVKKKAGSTDVQVESPGKSVDVKVTGTEAAPDSDQLFSVAGAGGNHTHTCLEGQEVRVEGASNTVVLHGPCKSVKVAGSSNSVETDIAAAIAVEGTANSVKWRAALKGKKPAIAKAGLNNTVEQLK